MELMKKTIEYDIQARDVDCNDVIKPLAILDIFQDIASTHATELGIGYEVIKKRNFAWIVMYQQFEIKKVPGFAEHIKISSWPKPKGRLEFGRELLIQNSQGETLVQGISTWVVLDMQSLNLVRASEIELNGIYEEYTNYPDKPKRKLNLSKELITDSFNYQVTYDDLDHNGHMNNAKYINIIFNHYPLYGTKKYIYKAEIAYIKEAKYQDVMTIGHYKIEEDDAYIASIGEQICFECVIGVKKL
ncbi:MAG: hypothetical protein K2H02_02600 [Anaeroplasmataceae bacterium]|nr:hypothetical protein [Anaeroplasmataceae bacterium]